MKREHHLNHADSTHPCVQCHDLLQGQTCVKNVYKNVMTIFEMEALARTDPTSKLTIHLWLVTNGVPKKKVYPGVTLTAKNTRFHDEKKFHRIAPHLVNQVDHKGKDTGKKSWQGKVHHTWQSFWGDFLL